MFNPIMEDLRQCACLNRLLNSVMLVLMGTLLFSSENLLASSEREERVGVFAGLPKYLPRETFLRISEYFTGVENTGRRLILRTNPEMRAGMYFILSLDKPADQLPQDCRIRIETIGSGSPEIQTFTLFFPNDAGNHREVFAGLTGADWPGPDQELVAWKIILEDGDGRSLLERQSFLWEFEPAS